MNNNIILLAMPTRLESTRPVMAVAADSKTPVCVFVTGLNMRRRYSVQ